MTGRERELLRQYFAGYFHQDWALDATSTEEVLKRYVADHAGHPVIGELAAAISSFVEAYPDDGDLEAALLDEMGSYFVPSYVGLSPRSWLLNTATTLRRATESGPES